MKHLFAAAFVCVALCALPAFGQEHTTRFAVSEDFLHQWAAEPVRDVHVTLACAGPIHAPEQDCELHIGASYTDPSVSDYQDLVLEPPNVCKDPQNWRATITALRGQDCTGYGFVRAWPEHLKNGSGCSNPKHAMEVHPMTRLTCASTSLDFSSMLRAYSDIGFKTPTIVSKMLDMNVWVCEDCQGAEGLKTISIDYCFGNPCTAGQASNFARFSAKIIRSTIRPATGKTLPGIASVIARVKPRGSNTAQWRALKLYAIEGTPFYDQLVAERGKTGGSRRGTFWGFSPSTRLAFCARWRMSNLCRARGHSSRTRSV